MQFILKSLCKESAGFLSERCLWGAFIRAAERGVTLRVFACPPPSSHREQEQTCLWLLLPYTSSKKFLWKSLTQVFCRELNMQVEVSWVHCVPQDAGFGCLFYKNRTPGREQLIDVEHWQPSQKSPGHSFGQHWAVFDGAALGYC